MDCNKIIRCRGHTNYYDSPLQWDTNIPIRLAEARNDEHSRWQRDCAETESILHG